MPIDTGGLLDKHAWPTQRQLSHRQKPEASCVNAQSDAQQSHRASINSANESELHNPWPGNFQRIDCVRRRHHWCVCFAFYIHIFFSIQNAFALMAVVFVHFRDARGVQYYRVDALSRLVRRSPSVRKTNTSLSHPRAGRACRVSHLPCIIFVRLFALLVQSSATQQQTDTTTKSDRRRSAWCVAQGRPREMARACVLCLRKNVGRPSR